MDEFKEISEQLGSLRIAGANLGKSGLVGFSSLSEIKGVDLSDE